MLRRQTCLLSFKEASAVIFYNIMWIALNKIGQKLIISSG